MRNQLMLLFNLIPRFHEVDLKKRGSGAAEKLHLHSLRRRASTCSLLTILLKYDLLHHLADRQLLGK